MCRGVGWGVRDVILCRLNNPKRLIMCSALTTIVIAVIIAVIRQKETNRILADLSAHFVSGSTSPDGAVVVSMDNGLVGTEFASRYRLQPRAGF